MLMSLIRCCIRGRKDDEWLPMPPWSVNAWKALTGAIDTESASNAKITMRGGRDRMNTTENSRSS